MVLCPRGQRRRVTVTALVIRVGMTARLVCGIKGSR